MTPYRTKEELEKLFDEKWENEDFLYKSQITTSKIAVISFIHTIRQQDIEAIKERLEMLKEQELPKACEDYSGDMDERVRFDDGYTAALSDILAYIEGLEK